MGSYSGMADLEGADEIRLDRYIAERLKLLNRSQLKTRSLQAVVNGKEAKLSKLIKTGDALELNWQDAAPENLVPQNIPLDILYEDKNVIVVNKPAGMIVHPGAGNRTGTLANALLYRRICRESGPAAVPAFPVPACGERTGIVHRLDKDTSGVIIAAWNDEALAFLAGQFKQRLAKKRYAAIVRGRMKENSGRIDKPIIRDPSDRKRFTVSEDPFKGKPAVTRYKVIRNWGDYALLLVRPATGRTHQIRVHLRSIGNPVAGDLVYGPPDPAFPKTGLMLHSSRLEITLPGADKPSVFRAPLPTRFEEMMAALNRRSYPL
jgi:23S rRNA pseudouridine1911/1915/1917 synthase